MLHSAASFPLHVYFSCCVNSWDVEAGGDSQKSKGSMRDGIKETITQLKKYLSSYNNLPLSQTVTVSCVDSQYS